MKDLALFLLFVGICGVVMKNIVDEHYHHPANFVDKPYCEETKAYIRGRVILAKRCWKTQLVLDEVK